MRHADLWKRILKLIRLFESSPNRCVEVMHVKAHDGDAGNERADKLAKLGSKLRFKLMQNQASSPNWFKNLYIYIGITENPQYNVYT